MNHALKVSAGGVQNVVSVLKSRGLLQDITSEELGALSAEEALTVYVGFDPTADAIHIGNLLAIIVLSWFQRCGHNAVALLGGATGRVGDPSGKSAERPVLSTEEIEGNVAGIGGIIRGILERNRGDMAEVKVLPRPGVATATESVGAMLVLPLALSALVQAGRAAGRVRAVASSRSSSTPCRSSNVRTLRPCMKPNAACRL